MWARGADRATFCRRVTCGEGTLVSLFVSSPPLPPPRCGAVRFGGFGTAEFCCENPGRDGGEVAGCFPWQGVLGYTTRVLFCNDIFPSPPQPLLSFLRARSPCSVWEGTGNVPRGTKHQRCGCPLVRASFGAGVLGMSLFHDYR